MLGLVGIVNVSHAETRGESKLIHADVAANIQQGIMDECLVYESPSLIVGDTVLIEKSKGIHFSEIEFHIGEARFELDDLESRGVDVTEGRTLIREAEDLLAKIKALQDEGKDNEAKDMFARILEKDPENPAILRLRQQMEEREHDKKRKKKTNH